MTIKEICVCCPPHLEEEAGPEVCPGLGPAERPVAGQVSPLDGEHSVGRSHQQHPRREAQRLGGAEQEEGCGTTSHISFALMGLLVPSFTMSELYIINYLGMK